jgi:hypothetical protein
MSSSFYQSFRHPFFLLRAAQNKLSQVANRSDDKKILGEGIAATDPKPRGDCGLKNFDGCRESRI